MTVMRRLSAIVAFAFPSVLPIAHAAEIVAPNAYADTAGYEYQSSIFGNGSTADVSFQEGFDASQFAGLAKGTTITGIGYRLPSNLGGNADAIDYADFTVRIGTSTVPIASLGLDKAANEGADTIVARTGAFTLPANALTNTGAATNPFLTINFATPYTYNGGDLLLTTSYSVQGAVPIIGVDAIDPFGVVNTIGGNDPAFLRSHTFNAPVVMFSYAAGAVPEPQSWALMVVGFAVTGAALRSRKRAALA